DRRRRRGTKCCARARRHRRPAVRDPDDVTDRALPVRHAAQRQRRKAASWRFRGGSGMTEIRTQPKSENDEDRVDPQTERVLALPDGRRRGRRHYGGVLFGGSALLLLLA